MREATTREALTTLWMMDTGSTTCAKDKLFMGTANKSDCNPADGQCLDYIDLYVKKEHEHWQGLVGFFQSSMFIAAFCYMGARFALHQLTRSDSALCSCCCGPCKKFMLGYLKKGGPVSLNALMIINTKLTWDENLGGYSLGLGQFELIFFIGNLILMILGIFLFIFTFVLPFCCAGFFKLCCCCCPTLRKCCLNKVLKGSRGYSILMLYVLSTWGLLTMVVTAFINFYSANMSVGGISMPQTPSAMLESFPLVDIVMTMFMVPKGLSTQLGSRVQLAQFVAAIRTLKVLTHTDGPDIKYTVLCANAPVFIHQGGRGDDAVRHRHPADGQGVQGTRPPHEVLQPLCPLMVRPGNMVKVLRSAVPQLAPCALSGRARLATPRGSALPECGPATGHPATASGAQASCLQSRRFRCV